MYNIFLFRIATKCGNKKKKFNMAFDDLVKDYALKYFIMLQFLY